MVVLKKVYSKILVSFAFVGLLYYAGECVAFANSVIWHKNNHRLVCIIGLDGKLKKPESIKIGDYYLVGNKDFKLYLNQDLEDKQCCSICKGEKDKPLLIKMIWPLFSINKNQNNKNLAKK